MGIFDVTCLFSADRLKKPFFHFSDLKIGIFADYFEVAYFEMSMLFHNVLTSLFNCAPIEGNNLQTTLGKMLQCQ